MINKSILEKMEINLQAEDAVFSPKVFVGPFEVSSTGNIANFRQAYR